MNNIKKTYMVGIVLVLLLVLTNLPGDKGVSGNIVSLDKIDPEFSVKSSLPKSDSNEFNRKNSATGAVEDIPDIIPESVIIPFNPKYDEFEEDLERLRNSLKTIEENNQMLEKELEKSVESLDGLSKQAKNSRVIVQQPAYEPTRQVQTAPIININQPQTSWLTFFLIFVNLILLGYVFVQAKGNKNYF